MVFVLITDMEYELFFKQISTFEVPIIYCLSLPVKNTSWEVKLLTIHIMSNHLKMLPVRGDGEMFTSSYAC